MGRNHAVSSLAMVIWIVFAAPLSAAIIPPDLPAGSEYQLIFATADLFPAGLAPNIGDYNGFVNSEAALNTNLPATSWNAVVSADPTNGANLSADVNANVNAPSGGYPVYNTEGVEVATSAGIYAGSLLNPVDYDQYGAVTNLFVTTGSNPDGSIALGSALGDRFAVIGSVTASDYQWISWGAVGSDFGLYALSAPITVPSPEPTTLCLLGSALLMLGGRIAWRRGNR